MKMIFVRGVVLMQLLLSGCFTMARKDVRHSNALYEDVVISGKRMHLASDDKITITNTCPEGYLVDVKKGSKLIWEGITPNQSVTIHPSSTFRNEPVLFSVFVYEIKAGKKVKVYFQDEIIRLGGRPITGSWVVTKNHASLRYEQQYYHW